MKNIHSVKTCIIKRDQVTTTVEVNRNILGALRSFSAKASKPIDFDVALPYPLSAIPLSIGSCGLVVKALDSRSKGRGFESSYRPSVLR